MGSQIVDGFDQVVRLEAGQVVTIDGKQFRLIEGTRIFGRFENLQPVERPEPQERVFGFFGYGRER